VKLIKVHGGAAWLKANLISLYDSRWESEPLAVEKLFSDQHYRAWARKRFGDRQVANAMLKYQKARCKERKIRYRRDIELEAIARTFGMGRDKLTNIVNRSSRVIPKRRKKRQQI
jgi:hypothetical protein